VASPDFSQADHKNAVDRLLALGDEPELRSRCIATARELFSLEAGVAATTKSTLSFVGRSCGTKQAWAGYGEEHMTQPAQKTGAISVAPKASNDFQHFMGGCAYPGCTSRARSFASVGKMTNHHATHQDSREGDEGYRRIQLTSGTSRRRRWSDEERARIVTESFAPAANISAVARRHGVSGGLLHCWRKQARDLASEEAADTPTFVRIAIVANAPGVVLMMKPSPSTLRTSSPGAYSIGGAASRTAPDRRTALRLTDLVGIHFWGCRRWIPKREFVVFATRQRPRRVWKLSRS
jgi:transposase-like protein